MHIRAEQSTEGGGEELKCGTSNRDGDSASAREVATDACVISFVRNITVYSEGGGGGRLADLAAIQGESEDNPLWLSLCALCLCLHWLRLQRKDKRV